MKEGYAWGKILKKLEIKLIYRNSMTWSGSQYVILADKMKKFC